MQLKTWRKECRRNADATSRFQNFKYLLSSLPPLSKALLSTTIPKKEVKIWTWNSNTFQSLLFLWNSSLLILVQFPMSIIYQTNFSPQRCKTAVSIIWSQKQPMFRSTMGGKKRLDIVMDGLHIMKWKKHILWINLFCAMKKRLKETKTKAIQSTYKVKQTFLT